jgi:hypothetical protein
MTRRRGSMTHKMRDRKVGLRSREECGALGPVSLFESWKIGLKHAHHALPGSSKKHKTLSHHCGNLKLVSIMSDSSLSSCC